MEKRRHTGDLLKKSRGELEQIIKTAPEPPAPLRKRDEMVPGLIFSGRQELEPSEITKEIIAKVEQALCWQWPVEAVCLHAGISRQVFNILKKSPEYSERWSILRQRPEHIARRNIALDLEAGEVATSKWYLERRVKEYAPKGSVDHTVTQIVNEADVVSALERLVELSRQRAEHDTRGQSIDTMPAIEHANPESDPLLQ